MGLLLTLFDAIHAYGGALSYADPFVGRQAWWVLPQFLIAGLGCAALARSLERRVAGPQPSPWTAPRLLAELALVAVIYVVGGQVNGSSALVFAGALGALAMLRLRREGTPGDLIYVLLAGAIGALTEMLILLSDQYVYAHPEVGGVPLWLITMWGYGGFVMRRFLLTVSWRCGAGSADVEEEEPA